MEYYGVGLTSLRLKSEIDYAFDNFFKKIGYLKMVQFISYDASENTLNKGGDLEYFDLSHINTSLKYIISLGDLNII